MISASQPVAAPAVSGINYDKWFVTQFLAKLDGTKAKTSIHLQRANLDNGVVLMPESEDGSSGIAINLDMMKEMADTPELGALMDAINAAVLAYATKKNLL
jgi:hypothetical protein